MPDTPAARAGRAAAALFRPRSGAAAGEPSPPRPSFAAAVGRNLGHATGILTSPAASSSAPCSTGTAASTPALSAASSSSGAVGRSLGRAAAVWFRPAATAADEADATAAAVASATARPAAGGGGYVRALRHSSHHFLHSLGRVAHHLWLQISGVLYLLFAIGFGAEGYRNWAADHRAVAAHAASLTQMSPTSAIELGLCLVFAYFGFSAWARARQH